MVSQFVFNPQSLPAKKELDHSVANEAMEKLLDFVRTIKQHKLDRSVIRINKHLAQENFMAGYPFMEWCQKFTKNQAQRALILALLVNNSKLHIPAWIGLSESEERIGKDYCFDDTTWALSYFFDFVLFSLHTESRWDTELFECEYFDLTINDDDTQTAFIRHASRGNHVLLHRRIYYCHPKHCHHLPFNGQRGTEMDLKYEDEPYGDKEAELILRDAVKIPTKKQLIGYSKRTERLYEFQPEAPPRDKPCLGDQNRYHGYPIEPEELHRDVGGRVYNEIIDSLQERAVIDIKAARRLKIT